MLRKIWLLCFTALLASCSTSPAKTLYILTANAETHDGSLLEVNEQSLPLSESVIGIGPIAVPEYLQRLPVAREVTGNVLQQSSLNQWAEPLDSAITRVIAENLSRLQPDRFTLIYPWRAENSPRYAVRVNVVNLAQQSGSRVILEANWALVDLASKQVVRRSKFHQTQGLTRQATGAEAVYAELAGVYSDLLTLLSQDIDRALKEI